MTVRELRELLATLPDEAEMLHCDSEGYVVGLQYVDYTSDKPVLTKASFFQLEHCPDRSKVTGVLI